MTNAQIQARVDARRRISREPTTLAVTVATAYLEIRAGRRPARQIEPLLTPTCRDELRRIVRHARSATRPTGGVSVSRVIVSRQGPHLLDAVVVARAGTRHGAVAVRVEHRSEGWLVTALGAPEDQ